MPNKKDNMIKLQVEEVADMLRNNVVNINMGGEIGKILYSNQVNWIHSVLEKNPNLFLAFYKPETNELSKTMWHGEFPGKILSGIAQSYLLNNDPKTKEIGEKIVEEFKKAQGEDGYLGPWKQSVRFNNDVEDHRKTEPAGKWDTWGQYHCIYGLLRWYQITGNEDALNVAIKAMDHIYDYFYNNDRLIVSQKWAECNFAISHAFALMYEQTGKEEYLKAAEKIVNEEWKIEYGDFYQRRLLSCDWLDTALEEDRAFCDSNQKRWESVHTIETLVVLYRVTGNQKYGDGAAKLWRGMVENDRHNTGSFGTGEGATGDVYGHGSETCNIVAWTSFSIDYLKMSRDSYVADELELSFYNASLGSLLDGEREFTYMNNSDGNRESALIVLDGHSFDGGRDMSCCQANGNRGLTQVAEWAVLTGKEGIYLNYFGQSNINTYTDLGLNVSLLEETQYPASGNIKITVNPEKEAEFALFIRIPTWSANTVLSVNGGKAENVISGQYYKITRKWKAGDVIELNLDMSIHFWRSEPGTIGNKVSAYYGPLLLSFKVTDEVRETTNFNRDSFTNYSVTEGEGLVDLKVNSQTGKEIILLDYYTAGRKGEKFVTWLSVNKDFAVNLNEKDPIWNGK